MTDYYTSTGQDFIGPPAPPVPGNNNRCFVPDCYTVIGRSGSRGMCGKHYAQWSKYVKAKSQVC